MVWLLSALALFCGYNLIVSAINLQRWHDRAGIFPTKFANENITKAEQRFIKWVGLFILSIIAVVLFI